MQKLNQLMVPANINALNEAVEAHGLTTSDIVSITEVPAQTMMTPKPAQFRVIYRS